MSDDRHSQKNNRDRGWKIKSRIILRLFEQSVGFRIGLALIIAYVFILLVSWVEHLIQGQTICLGQDSFLECLARELLSIIAVENIESFSISAAAVLYILETRERRQKAIYEAWQVIDLDVRRRLHGVEATTRACSPFADQRSPRRRSR